GRPDMPINLDEALGAELDPVEFSWTSGDIQLYHLGLGAGQDPMDRRELRYLTDDTPQVQKRSIFARGEGNFGGERGPSTSSQPPQRASDLELAIPVSPQQALLYRMCGD